MSHIKSIQKKDIKNYALRDEKLEPLFRNLSNEFMFS